jgi:hypothetical protein
LSYAERASVEPGALLVESKSNTKFGIRLLLIF